MNDRNDGEIAEANQAYGALTEGLYIAGFTFLRVRTASNARIMLGNSRTRGERNHDNL